MYTNILLTESTYQTALRLQSNNKKERKALLRFYQLRFHWLIMSSSGNDLLSI